MENKEFKIIEKKNQLIRNEISFRLLCCKTGVSPEDVDYLWNQINLLINNEIEQEKYCNQ